LDGYPPIYCLSTLNATAPTLQNRAVQVASIQLGIFDETQTSATGSPVSSLESSGMFVSSVRYNFPLDGNFMEEVTLVGNNKLWKNAPHSTMWNDWDSKILVTGQFNGLGSPAAVIGVARRQDLIWGSSSTSGLDTNSAAADSEVTVLPREVAGVTSSGLNAADNTRAHLSNLSISCAMNRENLNELGRKGPYTRTVTFPVEVTTEVEITATSGDMISATESGIFNSAASCSQDSGNLRNGTIRIATCEGLRVYAGLKNKLSSVNYTGADAGGGNVSVSYTFTTYNDFTVIHTGEGGLTGNNWAGGAGFGYEIAASSGFYITGRGFLVN
jgi:hypothetical protein